MTQMIADRYRVDQLLASINNAKFYKGHDLETQQTVIVRLIDLEKGIPKVLAALQCGMANEKELHRMQKLKESSILQTLDLGQQENIYYQINEFVDFKTLRDEINQNPCDLQTALSYGRDIAAITAKLHEIGIIHCDIKPDTILVTDEGLKLIEFSIANFTIPEGHATGTPTHMSPEAVQGAPFAAARDVWALGVTLYELISGSLPYPMPAGENGYQSTMMLMKNIATEPVPSLEDAVPDLPARLVTLMHAMLEKDPAQRIAHMRLVAQELDAILSEFSMS